MITALKRGRPQKTGMRLSDCDEGSLIKIAENGTPVEFYVAKHDYESGLNGNGCTLVLRKDLSESRPWNSYEQINAYSESSIDDYLQNYKNMLSDVAKKRIRPTTFYYTPGNGNYSVTTLTREIFIPSLTEIGWEIGAYGNVEGTRLPVSDLVHNDIQWTRTPYIMSAPTSACGIYNFLVIGAMGRNVSMSINFHILFSLSSNSIIDPNTLEVIA